MCYCCAPIICHLFKLETEGEEGVRSPSMPPRYPNRPDTRPLPFLPLSLEVVSLFTLDAAALSTETIRMTGATKVHSEEEGKGRGRKEGQKASLSEMHFVD